MRYGDRVETHRFGELNAQVPKAADAEDRNPIARLRLGPAESRPDGVPGTENRRGLLICETLRYEHRRIRVRQHVLGVTAADLHACPDPVGAKHGLAARTPLASSARRLPPRYADAVPHLAARDRRADGDDLTDRLVTEYPWKRPREFASRLMHIRVANAAGLDLEDDLCRSRLWRWHVLDDPCAID